MTPASDKRAVFVAVKTRAGTLSGLLEVHPSATAQEVLRLQQALQETADNTVDEWDLYATGRQRAP